LYKYVDNLSEEFTESELEKEDNIFKGNGLDINQNNRPDNTHATIIDPNGEDRQGMLQYLKKIIQLF